MNANTTQSESLVATGFTFDLFRVPSAEPFIAMYGISSVFGYKLTVEQQQLVRGSLHTRALFEKWQKFGQELKARTRALPEWMKSVEVPR